MEIFIHHSTASRLTDLLTVAGHWKEAKPVIEYIYYSVTLWLDLDARLYAAIYVLHREGDATCVAVGDFINTETGEVETIQSNDIFMLWESRLTEQTVKLSPMKGAKKGE